MKNFVCILGLVAACTAGGIESSGSHDQGDNSGWQPSNAAALDYSNLAGTGHYLAGLSHDYQALSHGHEAPLSHGQSFGHDIPQSSQFSHDASHGYDLSNHGQAKSFDVGSHSPLPSFSATGHDFNGDSYLQAAHDFGNHDQGSYNTHAGDFSGQGSNTHEESSEHGGEASAEGQHGKSDESHAHGDAGGNTQAFILHDGGHDYGHGGQHATVQDLGAQGYAGHGFGGQLVQGYEGGLDNAEPFTVGEHTDEQHPVEVPLYKHVTVPYQKPIHVNVPKPILIGIPQPYPVKVPVNKPVAVPVETEISIPIEKVVPYPVVKHVPYPVEKHVPFKVEKTIHVHVPQPYPVKVPIYKTIHHHKDH